MEFKNGVFNAARDGNLRRLKTDGRAPGSRRPPGEAAQHGGRGRHGALLVRIYAKVTSTTAVTHWVAGQPATAQREALGESGMSSRAAHPPSVRHAALAYRGKRLCGVAVGRCSSSSSSRAVMWVRRESGRPGP
ncbi:uncharacterized protein LOC135100748 [Scylla paramamosain]|uniref:uncharacterized protein LOC135100748 n=1 Tax=Scylla paramamosain TaxID=85552 RepID=UPI003083131D